jgi:hypothetical protein
VAYLRQAYAFHPDSRRVQAALRQARSQQLESAVGDLKPGRSLVRGLPAERDLGHPPAPCRDEDWRPRPSALREAVSSGWPSAFPKLTISAKVDVAAWLAFGLPLVVYLLTTCSTVYNLDSAELSAAAHSLGIVRATGYPLYLIAGKLFAVLLPVGDIGFRLNAMSAVFAAGTVAMLYHLLLLLTEQRAASLAGSLLFAFSYYFWSQAVVAEVYTLHTLLLAAVLLLLLRWEASQSGKVLAAIGLLLGLSFGNHMSTLLLIPGVGLFLLVVAGRDLLHPRQVLWFLLPFGLGLGIYVYLPLRYVAQPAFNYVGHYDAAGQFVPLDLTQLENIWWLVSGQGFWELMFNYAPLELVGEIKQVSYRLWAGFLGIGLAPGILGVWAQARRRPRYFLLLSLVFGAHVAFFAAYRVVDKAVMFLPAYLVWAIWIGEGYACLIRWIRGRSGVEKIGSPAWAWGLTTLAIVALVVNWALVDVRADTRARDKAEAILSAADPEAIVFGWWTSAPPVHYLQIVEGRRPDVLMINRFLIGEDEMHTLIDRSLGKRPVYAVELDPGLIDAYRTLSVGPMFELVPRRAAGMGP